MQNQNDKHYDNLRENITDEQIDFLCDFLTNLFSEEQGPSIQAHFGTDELEEMWMILKMMTDDKHGTLYDNKMSREMPLIWDDYDDLGKPNQDAGFSFGGRENGWEFPTQDGPMEAL